MSDCEIWDACGAGKLAVLRGKGAFISGPITGVDNLNREAFRRAWAAAKDNGASWCFDPTRLADAFGENRSHEWYMRRTLHELTGPSGFAGKDLAYDFILMLPGWKGSVGARLERAVAEACGIKVIEL